MSSLYTHQAANIRKTWFLMTGFLVVVIALGWLSAQIYESTVILYIAVVFALVMNVTAYWWSDKIVLALYKAKENAKTTAQQIKQLILSD